MTLDLVWAVLGILGGLSVCLFGAWVWWRLRTHEGLIYRTAWNLEALAGALRRREEEDP